MTSARRIAAPVALALSIALVPLLSGCMGNPIESVIEGATGGEVDLGGSSLPSGYPEQEVPVIDGEILFGGGLGSGDSKVFNVTIRVSGETAIDDIRAQLEGAGIVAQADVGGAAAGTFVGTSDAWGVLVVVSEDGTNGWVANYTVTPAVTP
ncbi:hypothetical protein M2152_000573 [Microbacteriaceae bacterium SG_E_30_P1]|uniref:Lipoprotein n=1 Tax=Antiquaquibacter oligotrophicus TaxID=2880260 RepID=A0ABT6KKB3_9MICO|nr:hypothetical protein [Antiquaquibacter oligotrophicus]MDH6180391.1 hypothetical protein [Antiquaquibacter oligotrophicus]UDF13868.1 hypothetical protein LH407_03150 [Antiquaquibacter oligotrophicus]